MLKWTFWSASDSFIKSSWFQSTQDGHPVWVFFLMKKSNGKYKIRNFRRFLFGMSPAVPAFKVFDFTSDFNFWIGVVDILTQMLFTLLPIMALPILRKISICHRWFLLGVSYYVNFHFSYTLKKDKWITISWIWWAKFELQCLLLTFIHSNSKFNVTWKNVDFECRYIRTHSEEKPSKISNITFAILPFLIKIL